jgi:hypothetical protein
MLDRLRLNGLMPHVEYAGTSLGINWGEVWSLTQQYGVVVIEILPELLPLIQAQNWTGVLTLILAKLNTPVPTVVPAK